MRLAARDQSMLARLLLRRRLQRRGLRCQMYLILCRERLLFLREQLRRSLRRRRQNRNRRCLKHLVRRRKRLLFHLVRLWGCLRSLRTSGVEFRTHHPTYIEVTLRLCDVAADLFFQRFGIGPAHLCAETTQERQGEWCVLVEIDGVEVE
jgi:hypothetical protein